jgi:hypothetical protein
LLGVDNIKTRLLAAVSQPNNGKISCFLVCSFGGIPSDGRVAEYTSEANSILSGITACVDRIIG